MNKLLLAVGCLTMAATVGATPINITTNMGYNDHNVYIAKSEDGNVDFNSENLQEFDLEAFYFDDGILSMKSGFNAFAQQRENITLGDIFIDIEGTDVVWDYAIKFNRDNRKFINNGYEILDLSAGFTSTPLIPRYNGIPYDHTLALPFAVATGGVALVTAAPLTFNYDIDGSHYTIEGLDIASITAGKSFTVHVTESCGNDVMTGSVPEPMFLSLLGISFVSLALIRRKR